MQTMFGRSAEEILKALKLYDWFKSAKEGDVIDKSAWDFKGEKKMTREEAVKIINKVLNGNHGTKIISAEKTVELYEALGLIKFEEAPGPDCRDLIFSSSKPLAYQAIAQLEGLGYTVTLNGKGK